MDNIFSEVSAMSIQLFALMTPPAVLSAFLSHTRAYDARRKHAVAFKASCAMFILGSVLFVWGSSLFELFGFTLDAFRIGSGVLLMLTAIQLMRDDGDEDAPGHVEGDISVVPLAIPLGMGPASIGAVMVLGAQATSAPRLLAGVFALLLAAACMFVLLLSADIFNRILGRAGIAVLAKLTGLLLAAIAAQVVFTGVAGFLS